MKASEFYVVFNNYSDINEENKKIMHDPKSIFMSVIGPLHASSTLYFIDNPSDAHTNSRHFHHRVALANVRLVQQSRARSTNHGEPHLVPSAPSAYNCYKYPHYTVADPGFPVGGGVDLVKGSVDSRGGYVSEILYVKTKESGPVGGGALARPPQIHQCYNLYYCYQYSNFLLVAVKASVKGLLI